MRDRLILGFLLSAGQPQALPRRCCGPSDNRLPRLPGWAGAGCSRARCGPAGGLAVLEVGEALLTAVRRSAREQSTYREGSACLDA